MYNCVKGFSVSILLALTLGGCVTLPSGPSVMTLPGSGKSFDQFQADDFVCRQWAGERIGLPPQEAVNQNVASGAVAGTAIGAGLGAAIGAAAGNPGIGAAIGAASGLMVGTSSGLNAGYAYGWDAQRRYDMSYLQCMYAKGNQVPVSRSRSQRYQTPPSGFNLVPPDYTP